MKRYTEYMEIESPWIKSIPTSWNVKRLKSVTTYISRGETPAYTDNTSCAKVINQATFSRGYWNTKKVRYTSANAIGNESVPKRGDVLLASTGGGVLGKVFYFDQSGTYIADSHVTIIRTCEALNGRFLYYYLSVHYDTINGLLARGSTNQTELQEYPLKNMPIPLPPREEQDQIVRYLDWQVSKINQLIAAKRKQIELINEQQQCIINKAILQGISNGKRISIHTKEWFGAIPSNWHTQRIKYLFQLRDERSYLPLEDVNLISLYSKLGVVQNKDIEYTSGNKARNADGYKKVFYDDIVVNIILCWMGAIGRSAYNGVTSPAYDVYQPQKGTCSKYYHYLFRLKAFGDECYKVGKGIMTMRWRVYSDQFCNIIVPVPPLDEQEHIVKWLDERLTAYRKNILMIEKEISCLHELRTRLISDVVTGQVDVRGIEVPEFEMVNEIDTEEPVEEENEQIE